MRIHEGGRGRTSVRGVDEGGAGGRERTEECTGADERARTQGRRPTEEPLAAPV